MPAYLPWLTEQDTPNSPCVADERTALTRDELTDRARAFAAQLEQHGVGRSDIIAVMLPNRLELLVAMFGAWYLGAAMTPVNPVFTDTEAAHQITDSGAKVLVCMEPERFKGQFGDAVTTIGVDSVLADTPSTDATSPTAPAELSGDDLALVIYTSGSTGRPKGVMLGHSQLDAMSAQMEERMTITGWDHCALILPLFHVNAILLSVLTPLRVGARITVIERFSPREFLETVAAVRPTYFSSVPTILGRLTDLPLDDRPTTDSLRVIVCGAAPASPELLHRVEEQFGVAVVEGYGLTEATCASSCNPVDGVRKTGTVGPAMPGQHIRIVDGHGTDLPAGTPGEVLISGPTVMQGYLHRPETTAETVVDDWLHTGDIGTLDEDGYLSIVDRIKDMIIRAGENIYPKEIEATLYGVDGVLEAAVVARDHPDYGEVPVAVVSLASGSVLTSDDLLDHCRAHLTKIKIPVDLQILDDIPKNPVGKIDKPSLRAQFSAAT